MRKGGSDEPSVAGGTLKEPSSDAVLDLGNGIAKLLRDSLSLERLDRVRVRRSGHDDEGDDRHLGSHLLEAVVEA